MKRNVVFALLVGLICLPLMGAVQEDLAALRKAAAQGDAEAQCELGNRYYLGRGVPEDYTEAAKWHRLAAEQGHAEAQCAMGNRYYLGKGIAQDFAQAYAWFDLAAAQGNDNAAARRRMILDEMTPAQIAEGKRLALEYAGKPVKKVIAPAGQGTAPPPLDEIQSLIDRGDFRAALDAANRVIAKSPRDSEAYRLRANARRNLGDLAGALEDGNKAVELNPSNARAFGGRSIVKRQLKDVPGALADVERALTLNANYHQGYDSRALLRLDSGDLAGALADANRAIELSPQTTSYFIRRASIRKAMKDTAAATADLARAIEINPKETIAYSQRALIRSDSGDLAGALDDLNRAIELGPLNGAYLLRRATLRRSLKDLAGADQDLIKVIELAPADPQGYFQRGLVRLDQKRWDEAIADNTRAIDLKLPNAAAAYNNRGLAYNNRGMLAEARRDYDQALKIQPGNKSATSNLARLDKLPANASAVVSPAKTVPGTAVPIPSLPKASEDTLWVAPAGPTFTIPTDALPIALGSAPNPVTTAEGLDSGATALAMEGLRRLAGPLSPGDEKTFNQKWQPFFDFPTPESDAYFQKLGPTLTELTAVQGIVARSAASLDYAWTDAVVALAAGDKTGAAQSLEIASHHARRLGSANARLNRISADVQKLGNPPNPVEAKKKAAKRFLKYFVSNELPHFAYLWRILQRGAANIDERLAASMKWSANNPGHTKLEIVGRRSNGAAIYEERTTPGKPEPADLFKPSWPSEESVWTQWFTAGKQGPEPTISTAPPKSIQGEAGALNDQLMPTDLDPFERPRFFYSVTLEQAATAAASGVRLVAPPDYKRAQAAAVTPAPTSAAPAPTPPPPIVDTAKQGEEEAKLRTDSIAEHQSWIDISKRNLAYNQAAYDREKDPAAKAELLRRVLNDKAEISSRNDQIHTIKTGEVVHTRTEADQFCHDLMIQRAQEQMAVAEQKIADIQATAKVAGFLAYQAYTASEEQKQQIGDFVARNLTPEDLANGNLAKAKKVAQATFDTVQGLQGQKAAAAELESIGSDEYFVGAERMQTGATYAGMLVSVGAPVYWAAAGVAGSTTTLIGIGAGSGFVTGSYQGGPVEGVKQAIAQTGLPGMVAAEMMTGYQRGGLFSNGGLVGAVERGAEAFLIGKAIEMGASRVGAWMAGAPKGGVPAAPANMTKPMTVEELIENESFHMMKRTAEQKISQYRTLKEKISKARQAIDQARKANTSVGELTADLAALEADRLKLAAKMNEDLLAKRILKGAGAEGRKPNGNFDDMALEADFADAQDVLYKTQVDPAFRNNVKQAGYQWRKKTPGGKWEPTGDLEFKGVRHKSSTDVKTVDTDRDCAVVEENSVKDNRHPGEIWQIFKGEKPVTLAESTEDLQSIYEQSYNQATGGNAKAAMQQITSSTSGDAYKSIGYLKMGSDPKNALAVEKAWVEQVGEVSKHKITLPAGDPLADNLTAKIDHANQIAKDVKERLLPYLKAIKAPAEDIKLFTDVQNALASMERDPVGATRQLKALTGLNTVAEVSDKITNKFVGAVKLGGAK